MPESQKVEGRKKIMHRLVLAISVVSTVGACGGGSGVDPYVDREASALALYSQMESLGYSDPASLPVTPGTVNYSGAIGADDNFGGRIIGDLTLAVRFSENSFSGQATNFQDNTNLRYEGSLTVSDGFIDRTADIENEYTFIADIDGVLTSNDGSILVDAAFLGDFTGSSQQGMIGILDGTAIIPGFGSYELNIDNTLWAAKR